jgi:hypothetical protein
VEPVSVKSARFTALHEGGSTEVTWDASEADVQRFSEAYAAARILDNNNGTTPPARIDAVLESGEPMVVWGGGQHFQTVRLDGQDVNVDGDDLHRLLEEIAARTASPRPGVGQSGPATQPAAVSTATPQEPAVPGETGGSAIALSDRGRTFTFRVTDRFRVSLDPTRYPVATLKLTPAGIAGLVSNGSINGPDDYPVMFEAVRPGECLLENGDFRVRIVVEP